MEEFELKINLIICPNITKLHRYISNKGLSKNEEWLQIEGVPCIIVKIENDIYLNSFTSSKNRVFIIDRKYLYSNFKLISINNDGFMLNLDKYPILININEFDKRDDVLLLEKIIKDIIKNKNISSIIRKIFNDKLPQLIVSQGSSYITIDEYYKYLNSEIILSKHKRFGCELFNRNSRWCPPINISYDDYIKSNSYPAPLGIRPKDFCLPSEIIETMEELISQIVNFKDITVEDYQLLKEKLPFINKFDYKCKYCGEYLSINEYISKYKSCDNYIEICHRDPNNRFIKNNIYWGHGSCNRRQGGFTEIDRMKDGIKLLLINNFITKNEYDIINNKL